MEVHTARGRYKKRVDHAKGQTLNPLSQQELEEKYLLHVSASLPFDVANETLTTLKSLVGSTNVENNDVCRRLMTVPGVGPIVSLAYVSTVDMPSRFRYSRAVGTVLGLTPVLNQSGEVGVGSGRGRNDTLSVRSVSCASDPALMTRLVQPDGPPQDQVDLCNFLYGFLVAICLYEVDQDLC